jgi:hypothetical protein
MSEVKALEAKIDSKFESQENSNTRLENAFIKLSDVVGGAMQTIMGVQARAEERHTSDQEFKREVKSEIAEVKKTFSDFKLKEFVPVRDGQRDNSRITNIIGIIASLIVGALAMKLFGA